jgi:putative ABC transport system substrate-binding protein
MTTRTLMMSWSDDCAVESVMRHGTMTWHLWRLLFAIAGAIALFPLDAPAQATAKVYRIGILGMTSPDPRAPNQMAFWEELRLRGYVEGRNLVVERRDAAGQVDLLPALARELVSLRPDLKARR